MNSRSLLLIACLIAVFLCGASNAGASQRSYGLCLRYAEVTFHDLELEERIYNRVVANPRVRITPPGVVDSMIREFDRYGSDIYVPEIMTELANSIDVRYLVWLKVEKAGVVQDDHTLVPYLFRSHSRKYRMEVRMFVLDVKSGKTVVSEYFDAKKDGPSALSYLDYDESDPKLFNSYSKVARAFDEMEEEISDKIAFEMLKLTHRR